MTAIEWTDVTWNPTRGCSRVSPGCQHCYAERMAIRLSGPGRPYRGLVRSGPEGKGPRWTGEVVLDPVSLGLPLHWSAPRMAFVNSMSDLFHERLTNEEIAAVHGVMAMCPQHTFQVLTKRDERLRSWHEWMSKKPVDERALFCANEALTRMTQADVERVAMPPQWWPLPNLWQGVSVESDDYVSRLVNLVHTPHQALRFASLEPLLAEPRQILEWIFKLDWVIVGGESGPGARPCAVEWIEAVVRECERSSVPCFVKQLGRAPTLGGPIAGSAPVRLRSSKGGDPSEWAKHLRVRDFPDPELVGRRQRAASHP